MKVLTLTRTVYHGRGLTGNPKDEKFYLNADHIAGLFPSDDTSRGNTQITLSTGVGGVWANETPEKIAEMMRNA